MGSLSAGSEQAEGAGTGAGAEGREGAAAGPIRFLRAIRRGPAAELIDAARAVAAADWPAAVFVGAVLALAATAATEADVRPVA
jgi:hypothetical protein